jgi:hypothetical protein
MQGLRAGLLAFSLLTPVCGGAFADETSEALARSFIDGIDKLDGWSAKAAAVKSDGSATLIEGLELKSDDGKAEVKTEQVRFDGLAADDSGMSTSAFSFTNVAIKAGDLVSYSIPLAEGKDLRVPSFAGWVFDPQKPVRSIALAYAKLAEIEIDRFSIPAATFKQQVQTPGATPTVLATGVYEAMVFENLKGGVLALQSIGKISSATESGDPSVPSFIFAFEGMSAKNTDFKAIARLFDPAAYKDGKGDMAWVNAVESGTYGKMSFIAGGKPVTTIANISFGPMQVRQPEKPFIDALDEMIQLGNQGGTVDDAKMLAFMEAHLPAITGWFKLTSVTMEGLEISPPEGGKIALAKTSIEDLSSDGLKRFALEGLSADAPDFSGKMKLFEVADVIWPSLVAYMKIGQMAQEQEKTGKVPDLAAISAITGRIFDLYPRFGRVAIEGIEASHPQMGQLFSLGSYLTTMTGDLAAGEPFTTTFEMNSLVLPGALLRLDPQSAQVFDALGYDGLTFNGIGNGTYTPADGGYDTTLAITATDAGTLKFGYELGGMTPERLQALVNLIIVSGDKDPDPVAMVGAMSGMSLDGMSMRFEDASLTKRVLKFGAQMQGMDEQTLIGNTTAMVQLGMSQAGVPEFTKQAVDAVTKFLNDPKSITIAVKPPKPVEAQEVMKLSPADPQAALTFFGVTVTAND